MRLRCLSYVIPTVGIRTSWSLASPFYFKTTGVTLCHDWLTGSVALFITCILSNANRYNSSYSWCYNVLMPVCHWEKGILLPLLDHWLIGCKVQLSSQSLFFGIYLKRFKNFCVNLVLGCWQICQPLEHFKSWQEWINACSLAVIWKKSAPWFKNKK